MSWFSPKNILPLDQKSVDEFLDEKIKYPNNFEDMVNGCLKNLYCVDDPITAQLQRQIE